MKRRDFIKTSALAAGLVGSVKTLEPLATGDSAIPDSNGASEADNRPIEYLRKGQAERFLPKAPALAKPYQVSPMPLAERVRRKIVPQRGFCSIAPGELVSQSLISGTAP